MNLFFNLDKVITVEDPGGRKAKRTWQHNMRNGKEELCPSLFLVLSSVKSM